MRRAALVVGVVMVGCVDAPQAGKSLEPREIWASDIGPETAIARAVSVHDDAIFAAGFFEAAESEAGVATQDAFVTRMDRDGSLAWTETWGSSASDFAVGVASAEAGGTLVAGYTPGALDERLPSGGHDAFITAFGVAGERRDTFSFGTSDDDYVYAMASTAGGAALAGYTRGSFPGSENAGDADLFVASIDASAKPRFIVQLGSEATDYAQGIAADSDGSVLVVGYTAGRLGALDAGAEDAFALKLTPSGEIAWITQWGSDTTDYAIGVASDAAHDVYVTGYTYGAIGDEASSGGEDAYLTKLDSSGNVRWTRQWGTALRDSARSVVAAESGDIYVSGDTEGAIGEVTAGERDVFLSRFTSEGERTFTAQRSSRRREFALASALDGARLYVAGYAEVAGTRRATLTAWSIE